jgi:hypothetical protein
MRHAGSGRRWSGGALPFVLLTLGSSVAQSAPAEPSPVDAVAPAGAPDHTTGNTEAIEQALQRIDAALDRWNRSCSRPDAHGLCLVIEPVVRSKFRCDAPRLGRVRVEARRTKAAKRAHEVLRAAATEAEQTGPPTDPALTSRYWETLALARLALTDRDLERYLALRMPTNLDFHVEEWKQHSGIPRWEQEYRAQRARKQSSERRFKAYFEEKNARAQELRSAYTEVVDPMLPQVKPAIAVRRAFIAQHMADQLRAAFVPERLREPTLRAAYCDALADHAEPLEDEAREVVQWCIETATKHTLTGPAVDSCRALLDRYPEPPAD